MIKKILVVVLLIAIAAVAAPDPIRAYSSDHLVIHQVQTSGGPGQSSSDFIEILNPTQNPVDLNGHRLVKRTKWGTSDTTIKSWSTRTIIEPGSFYVWANSAYSGSAGLADETTSQTIADDNAIAIRFGAENTGVIVDSVGWGANASVFVEGAVYPANIPDGQSLVRLDDTGSNATDFKINSQPSLRSGSTQPGGSDPIVSVPSEPDNSPAPVKESEIKPEDIRISEAYFTDSKDRNNFVELRNFESHWVSLVGWKIILGDAVYEFPQGSSIPSKSYLALDKSLLKLAVTEVSWPKLELRDASGVLVSVLPTAQVVLQKGQSLMLDGTKLVATFDPTPGRENHFIKTDPNKKVVATVSKVAVQKPTAKNELKPDLGALDQASRSSSVPAAALGTRPKVEIAKVKPKTLFHRFFGLLCRHLLKCK